MPDIIIRKKVKLPGDHVTEVVLSSTEYPSLSIHNPYLWWPNGYGKECHITVMLKNTTGKLSFFNRFVITRGEKGGKVLPTFWDTNFIILFPGEAKTVNATIETEDLQGADPYLSIDGNNKVKPILMKNK